MSDSKLQRDTDIEFWLEGEARLMQERDDLTAKLDAEHAVYRLLAHQGSPKEYNHACIIDICGRKIKTVCDLLDTIRSRLREAVRGDLKEEGNE